MFLGYERPDGKYGVRNHVLILPCSVCASDTAQKIADCVKGAVSFHNQNGCSQVEHDQTYTMDMMAGYAANPNVYGTLVLSLGCENCQMDLVTEEIRKRTNKPLEKLIIQENGGTLSTIEKGVRIAVQMVQEAALIKRQAVELKHLIVGTECGGSDPTSGLAANPVVGAMSDILVAEGGTSILSETTEFIGAEHLLAARAADPSVEKRIYEIVSRYEEELERAGEHVRAGNPSPGNKAGGLTTLEEKSLGCIHKGGSSPIMHVYDYAEPIAHRGLVIMDTPGNDPASVAGMIAGGAQVITFTSGRGTPTGNPLAPVIKITGNRITWQNMRDNLDFDASPVIYGAGTVEDFGAKLLDEVIAVADGKPTKAEVMGFVETSVMRHCNYT